MGLTPDGRAGRHGSVGVFYAWVGPEVLDGIARAHLEQAVATLNQSREDVVDPADVHPITEAALWFVGITGINREPGWSERARDGRLLRVDGLCRNGVLLTRTGLVHVPTAIWRERRPQDVRRWWRSLSQPPMPAT